MIVLRFLIYGCITFAILGILIQMPLQGTLLLGLVGGLATSLSCLGLVLMGRLFKELRS